MVTDLAAVALGGGDAGLAQAGHAVTFPLPLHVSGAAVTRALSGHVCGQLLLQRGCLVLTRTPERLHSPHCSDRQ